MTMDVAREIAKTMLEEKDELVTALVLLKQRKRVGVIRLDLPSMGVGKLIAREVVTDLEELVKTLIDDIKQDEKVRFRTRGFVH